MDGDYVMMAKRACYGVRKITIRDYQNRKRDGKMKKGNLTWLVVMIAAGLLTVTWSAGCASTGELERMQSENAALAEELEALQLDYEELEESCAGLTAAAELKSPTWAELKEFLENDETDKGIYRPGEYDCTGFALALRDRARQAGIRAAFVEIGFYEGSGHAVNAFQTTDKGLVYIDSSGKAEPGDYDTVGYIETGKVYGRIDISEAEGFTYDYYQAHRQDVNRRWEPMGHVQVIETYW